MNSPLCLVSVVVLTFAVSCPAMAQAANVAARSREDAAAARAERRMQLLREANNASAMLAESRRADAAALRFKEAQSRLLAALLDEPAAAVPENVRALGRKLTKDEGLPDDQRFELARLLMMAERKGKRFETREDWLAAREGAARQLVTDFPGSELAYGELLAVAAAGDARRARQLTAEIAASPASPSLKRRAAEVALRFNVPGQTLPSVLADAPGGPQLIAWAENRLLILYTWAPENVRSVELAKSLSVAAPAEALVIGINLSPDVGGALTLARAERLPGEQLYGARGHDSPVVRHLGLSAPALLYAIGRDGIIHDLSGEADRVAALAKLN